MKETFFPAITFLSIMGKNLFPKKMDSLKCPTQKWKRNHWNTCEIWSRKHLLYFLLNGEEV